MGMDSYLELFTTMYGWFFSSVIVRAFADTGLLALPFVFILIGLWAEAHEDGWEDGGAERLVRKLEVKIWSSLFVIVTCVNASNLTAINHSSLSYVPMRTSVDPAPVAATGDDSQSTYGAAFADVPNVSAVPPWWYTVMTVSSGLNAAIRAGISGSVRDFRMIQDLAQIATVEDPRLRHEIQRFYSECFVPARSRFLRTEQAGPQTQAAIAARGESDVDWMGSLALRTDPAYYPTIYSRYDVPGFPYDPVRDSEVEPSGPIPTFGRPTCQDWWENDTAGLRNKMANTVGAIGDLRTRVAAAFTLTSEDELNDQLARLALQKASPSYIDPERILGDDRGAVQTALQAVTGVMGAAGATWEGLKASASMMPMITLMTMVQPILLMALYMFLPLVTIFSGYSLRVMLIGAIAIFTIKFWTVMWFIARWLDDHLIEAMYPGANGNVLLEAITTGLDGSYKRLILNILLMMVFLGLPLIWSGMMAWIGYNLSEGLGRMINAAADAGQRAGQTGVGMAAGAARRR